MNGSVIVVGCGPVGALTALGLARNGVPVTIVEREAAVIESPRAAVYHWSVLPGLERLGVFDRALDTGFPKQDYEYLVPATGEVIHWDIASLGRTERHPFNIHLGQNELVRIVLDELAGYPDVEVLWNRELAGVEQDAEAVVATVRDPDGGEHRLSASWLIGADGAGSAVRRALGLEFEGTTWAERFVATNIRYDFEAHGYAQSVLRIDPGSGAVIAKIHKSGLWRVTYMEPADLPEEGVLDRMPGRFAQILPGAGPEPRAYELDQYAPYRMHQRTAPSYRVGRVLLAGDAAHATNPVGGLGLTSGLFDLYLLYPALAAVIEGRASEAVLDEYSARRRAVFLDVVSPAASENKRLIYHSADPERLERDLEGLRALRTDPDVLEARLRFPKLVESAPLVAG